MPDRAGAEIERPPVTGGALAHGHAGRDDRVSGRHVERHAVVAAVEVPDIAECGGLSLFPALRATGGGDRHQVAEVVRGAAAPEDPVACGGLLAEELLHAAEACLLYT